MTRTAPTAPVYVCLDAGLQEQRLDKSRTCPTWRASRPAPARPAQERSR